MKDCVFCKIINDEIPSQKVWEDKNHVAFLTIFPNTVGFTVVATKEHKPSYAFENDDITLSKLTIATKKVAQILDLAFEDVGRCGMFFEGFGVDHLHSKLFPMHGTADMEKWEPIEKDMPDVFYKKYPGYLSSHNGPKATEDELEKVADTIRETAESLIK